MLASSIEAEYLIKLKIALIHKNRNRNRYLPEFLIDPADYYRLQRLKADSNLRLYFSISSKLKPTK